MSLHFAPPEASTAEVDVNDTINDQFQQHPFHDHAPKFDNSISNLQSKAAYAESSYAMVNGNLSTEEIIKLAAEEFIKFSTRTMTMFTHPYRSSMFRMRLTMEEIREKELIYQLLNAADEVGRKQYENASKYLTRCGWMANDGGTPVERLVYYLCEALHKRIQKETGIPTPTKLEKLVSFF